MGVLTHAQLVTEALELAGNTGLTTRGQTWLGLVLRNLFEKFTIPQQVALLGQFALSAGVAVYQAGVGGSFFSTNVVRGIRRCLIAATDGTDQQEIPVISGGKFEAGELPATGTTNGRPLRVYTSPETNTFLLTFTPTPNKAYLASVTADSVPVTPLAYNSVTVNLWPDDLTVIQGIYALALKHQQDERASSEWGLFEEMVKKDRVRYGNLNGDNSKVNLGGPHRTRVPSNRGPGWMGPV